MTAEKMQQMIRQKGTFIIAYVDVAQNLNDVYNNTMQALIKKQEEDTAAKIKQTEAASDKPSAATKEAEAKDAKKPKKLHKTTQDKPAFGGLSMSDMSMDTENNLFDNVSVEFPSYCRPLWKKDVELAIAKKAAEMLPCWNKAADSKNSTVLEMPFLDASQFAQFYACVAEGDKPTLTLTKDNIQSVDGLKKPSALLRIATFNDPFRKDIGWLEFWVYVCSNGKKPKEDSYMSTQEVPLEKLLLQKMQEEAKKKALRQKLFDEDKKKEAQAKVNAAGEGATLTKAAARLQHKHHKQQALENKEQAFIQGALHRMFLQAQKLLVSNN